MQSAGPSANLRGMLWMLGAAILFTLAAAAIKYLGRSLPLSELIFFRMGLGAVIMLPWMLHKGGIASIATQRLGTHFFRAVFGIGAFALYVYAINNMLLANATALAFTTPLWMIPISRILTGERAGATRAVATLIGFSGVLVIARPDIEISLPAVAALSGALLICIAMLYVKRLSTTESSEKLAFYVQVFGGLFLLPFTIHDWQDPTAGEWAIIGGMGLIGAIGLFCQARAYGTGDPTAVAPIDYTRLPMAILLGVMMFGELPDGPAFAGMAIILGTVLFLSYRERRARKSG
jgi:drug/metabolite transporter (DMT)-like permease